MKRILTLALALLLVLSLQASAIELPPELQALLAGSQLEVGEYSVLEERLNIHPSYFGTSVEYVAIVRNPHDKPLSFHYESKVDLLDQAGEVVASIDLLSVVPAVLPPDGVGYVFGKPSGLAEEDVGRIASYSPQLSGMKVTPEMEQETWLPLTASAEISVEEEESFFNPEITHGGKLQIRVENNTEATAYNVQTASVLRDQEGKLLTILLSSAYDIGIPAGSSIFLRNRLTDGLINLFMSQNTPAETAEAFAFFAAEP